MALMQYHDYQHDSCSREEVEEDCEEAEQEVADEEEEEANIEEYELNCFKPSITNSLFTGQRVCDQQDLDFLSKIRKNS